MRSLPVSVDVGGATGPIVANFESVKLDTSGRVCIVSFVGSDLLIDVTGYVVD
jgi:hypothetical protein